MIKLKEINIELSGLYLEFGENLLAETNKNFQLVIDNKEDLPGLPEDVIAGAAIAAEKAGETGKWVFTMAKPSWIPFLTFSDKRDLREQLYSGYFMRGDNDNESDNKETYSPRCFLHYPPRFPCLVVSPPPLSQLPTNPQSPLLCRPSPTYLFLHT